MNNYLLKHSVWKVPEMNSIKISRHKAAKPAASPRVGWHQHGYKEPEETRKVSRIIHLLCSDHGS